jgi:hypothetical protein
MQLESKKEKFLIGVTLSQMYRHLQKAQIYNLSHLLCTSVWILNLYITLYCRALLCETELEFKCHKLLLQAIVLLLTDHINTGWTLDSGYY